MEFSKKCEQCDKVFYKKLNTSKRIWLTVKFCSKPCANLAKQFIVCRTKKCVLCQEMFSIGSKGSVRDWNNRKYCSMKCADKCRTGGNSGSFKKGRIAPSGNQHPNWIEEMPRTNCVLCGIEFSKPRVKSQVAWAKQLYCSHTCAGKINAQLSPKGADHPGWRGGNVKLQIKIRRLYLYRKWRKEVLKKGLSMCSLCGVKDNLEVDHIYPFSRLLFENNIKSADDARICESLWKPENGRVLCTKCHMNTDTYGVKSSKVMRILQHNKSY